MYRSFSDRSTEAGVVTFDQHTPVVSPPQKAFGMSLPPRDPDGLLVTPTKGAFRRAVYRAAGRSVTFTAAPTHPHPGLLPTNPIRAAVPDSTGDRASRTLRFVVRVRT